VANWGLYQYYCVVSNVYGSVKSDLAEIAVGCGAKTTTGGWLKFMCHNLGASPVGSDQSLDEITFGSGTIDEDTLSSDVKGWLFQWGRAADGHQWRSSTSVQGPVILSDNDYSIPSGNEAYGKYVANNTTSPYDWRDPQKDETWRDWNDGRFPCPSGWRIPTSSEWGSIFRTGSSYGAADASTANTWKWTATGKGYQIKPNGSTTTLYLPGSGIRGLADATVTHTGSEAHYWSSTSRSAGAIQFFFYPDRVGTEIWVPRARGHSVRCMAV
jgi:uncharacterized protein (TIGR02145 family)